MPKVCVETHNKAIGNINIHRLLAEATFLPPIQFHSWNLNHSFQRPFNQIAIPFSTFATAVNLKTRREDDLRWRINPGDPNNYWS